MRRPLLAALLICAALSTHAENFSGAITLELVDGIFTKRENTDAKTCDLTLDISCENGKWSTELWGYSAPLSRFWHSGELASATGDADGELHLVAKMSVSRDVGHDVGDAEYKIDLKRTGLASAMLEGKFEGSFRGEKLKGIVIGRIKPLPAKVPGFEEVTSGEHPRLLFRKKEIPLLREKAKTPAGLAILAQLREKLKAPAAPREKSAHAAACGLLYILSGDKQQADAAMNIVEAALRDDFCTNRYLSSDALIGVALAYDLCYDAWTPEYRAVVSAFIDDRVRYMIVSDGYDPLQEGSAPSALDYDQNPGSEWQAKVRGAAAFAALAIAHDPSNTPPEPQPPQVRTIEPLADLDLGRGLPLNKIEHDVIPGRWLFTGPFSPPDKNAWGPQPPQGLLDYLESIGGHRHLRADIGTRVPAFGMTRDFTALPPLSFGKYIADRSVIDPGALTNFTAPSVCYFYTAIENDRARPVKVLTNVGWRIPQMALWLSGQEIKKGDLLQLAPGRHTLLVRVALEQPQPYLICPRLYLLSDEEFKTETDDRMAEWQAKKKEQETGGNRFEKVMRSEAVAEHALQRFLERGLFDCLDDSNPALPATLGRSLLPFLIAHRNVKGADFTTGTPGEKIVDFCLMQTLTDRTKPLPAFRPEWAAPGISASCVESSRPFIANAIDRFWGMRGDKSFGIAAPQHAVFALANLLHAAETTEAFDFPKSFKDPSGTVWVFRNGWKDADDIAATVNLSALQPKRVNRETLGPAFLKIAGLGSRWQLRENLEHDPATANREHTVVPPRNCVSDLRPDGSGFVSENGRDRNTSFAAEYSGASGAPAVFVIACKSESATFWTLDAGMNCAVSVGDQGFTVTAQSGTRLQGRFSTTPEKLHTRELSNVIEVSCKSDFTLALTLAKGTVPEATFDGIGKDLKIHIGPQQISFDAEKIIFAK